MRGDLNPRSVSHQILSLTPLTRLGYPCLCYKLDIVITVKIYKNKVTVILVLIYTITIRYFFLPDYLRQSIMPTGRLELPAIWLKAIRSTN